MAFAQRRFPVKDVNDANSLLCLAQKPNSLTVFEPSTGAPELRTSLERLIGSGDGHVDEQRLGRAAYQASSDERIKFIQCR